MKLFDKIDNLTGNEELVAQRRYGIIAVQDERLDSIRFRPWPKVGSVLESMWASSGWGQKRLQKNRCLVYYSQPVFHSSYLVINYIESCWQTTLACVSQALTVLDQIAEIKRSDALLCEVANPRISDRVMQRFGWERQKLRSEKRHWIKRFYGEYPKSHSSSSAGQNVARRAPLN